MFRRILHFGTEDHDYKQELTSAPIVCLNSDAGTLYDAFWQHPSSREYNAIVTRMMSMANFACRFRGTDGATSNERFFCVRVSSKHRVDAED